MKIFNLTAALLVLYSQAFAGNQCKSTPTIVGVIDTGFGYHSFGHDAKLCKYGHKDFSVDQKYDTTYGTADPIPVDFNDHGTNIVGTIQNNALYNNYCIVVIKYWSDKQDGTQNTAAESAAIRYATNIKVDFLNISSGGEGPSQEEYIVVENFLNRGGILVAAAGNENINLDLAGAYGGYYPAMYDPRIISVGNSNANGTRAPSSNYGDVVTAWEVGEYVTAYGITMSGTSQATAIHTGKMVSQIGKTCDIGDYDKH